MQLTDQDRKELGQSCYYALSAAFNRGKSGESFDLDKEAVRFADLIEDDFILTTTSPEPAADAVEAAAEAIRSTADAFFSGREVEQITSVKSAKQAFDRLYRQQARAALQAAAVEPDERIVRLEAQVHYLKDRIIDNAYWNWLNRHEHGDPPDEELVKRWRENLNINMKAAVGNAVRQTKENGDG